MTYINGNVYVAPAPAAPQDKVAHDACLPDSEFETVMLANWGAEPFTNDRGFLEYPKEPERMQKSPWRWWPGPYGAPKPCYVCGVPVDEKPVMPLSGHEETETEEGKRES